MGALQTIASWVTRFGAGGALGEHEGTQYNTPSGPLIGGLTHVSADVALQLGTIWACVDRRANVIASMPLNAYDVPRTGRRSEARGSRLWQLMHDSPNGRMTPYEFWRALMLNYDLRGNAYARIARESGAAGDPNREAVALWPMPSDQVEQFQSPAGDLWYLYHIDGTVFVYPAEDVLHLKNLGNGTSGFSKLEFMSPAIQEGRMQTDASAKVFGNGGKPTAILMTDKVLKPDQRAALQDRFVEMAAGNQSRLFVLEADMKYQQLTATAEQIQLLESRKHNDVQLCQWFDVPPVMVYTGNMTEWGTGIESIIDGWYKTTISPLCTNLEQAFRRAVMTPRQRASMEVDFDMATLLRANPKARFEIYSTGVQNGILTRDWCRAQEDLDAMGGGGSILTAQANLLPLDMLGKTMPRGEPQQGNQPQRQ